MGIYKRYHLPYLPLNPLSFTYTSLMEAAKIESLSGFIDNLFFAGRGYSEGYIMDLSDKRECFSFKGWSLSERKFIDLSFIERLYVRFLRKKLPPDLYRPFINMLKSYFGLGVYIHTLSQNICKFLNKYQIVLWPDDLGSIINVEWKSFVFYCAGPPVSHSAILGSDLSTPYYTFVDFPFSPPIYSHVYFYLGYSMVFFSFDKFKMDSCGQLTLFPHYFFCYVTRSDGKKYVYGGWFPLHEYKTNCVVFNGVPIVFCELL